MVTVKSDWVMPEPPDISCAHTGKPLTRARAVLAADLAWDLYYVCEDCDNCTDSPGSIIHEWPFVEDYASAKDMEAVGFEVDSRILAKPY